MHPLNLFSNKETKKTLTIESRSLSLNNFNSGKDLTRKSSMPKIFFSKKEKQKNVPPPSLSENDKKAINQFLETINSSFKLDQKGDVNLSLLDQKEWQAMVAIENIRQTPENYNFMQDYRKFVSIENKMKEGHELYNKYILETSKFVLNIDSEDFDFQSKQDFINKVENEMVDEKDFVDFFKSVAMCIGNLMKKTTLNSGSIQRNVLTEVGLLPKPDGTSPTKNLSNT